MLNRVKKQYFLVMGVNPIAPNLFKSGENMSDKILSINDIIEQERLAKGLVSTSELAKMLNTSNKDILDNAKKLFTNKKFENGKTTFFNEREVSEIIKNIDYDNSRAKEPLLAGKGQVKTELMLKEELKEQIEQAKQLPKQEKLTLALSTFQSLLEDLQKENKELTKENTELKEKEQERLYIENEKYKSKELRSKINKMIRKYCYNNNVNYSDFMIKLYRIYDNIHCFPFKENYKEYIDIIQERGHLKELYNIVLNSI